MKHTLIVSFILVALTVSGCTIDRGGANQPAAQLSEYSQISQLYSENDLVKDINQIKFGGQTPPSQADSSSNQQASMQQPQMENLIERYDRATLQTNKGNITVNFYAQESPVTVNNFLNLAQKGFYNNTIFHRVIKDFMIQGGDPLGTGTGGPGYQFQDEINQRKLVRGSLAMANSGPNTNGSQFFIVTASSTPWLDGKHTNFGEVVAGMEVVDAIEAVATAKGSDRPLEDVTIQSITLHERAE